MKNFLAGLSLINWAPSGELKYNNGYLEFPCYILSFSPSRRQKLEDLGFSWTTEGYLRIALKTAIQNLDLDRFRSPVK